MIPQLVLWENSKKILSNAMKVVVIAIRGNSSTTNKSAATYSRACASAILLLRNGLMKQDGFVGRELLAATLCLGIAEVYQPLLKPGICFINCSSLTTCVVYVSNVS
jgi:hypothetical protein